MILTAESDDCKLSADETYAMLDSWIVLMNRQQKHKMMIPITTS